VTRPILGSFDILPGSGSFGPPARSHFPLASARLGFAWFPLRLGFVWFCAHVGFVRLCAALGFDRCSALWSGRFGFGANACVDRCPENLGDSETTGKTPHGAPIRCSSRILVSGEKTQPAYTIIGILARHPAASGNGSLTIVDEPLVRWVHGTVGDRGPGAAVRHEQQIGAPPQIGSPT
jgi:hypothetical protein